MLQTSLQIIPSIVLKLGYNFLMKKSLVLIGIVGIGVLLAIAGCRTSRSAYKSAPYTIIRSDGNFEIRDYPALRVVESAMKNGGSGGSFNRLFRYISGGNDAGKKIAMTTPVFMDGGEGTMAFFMPEDLGKVPQPTDQSVRVREIPAGRIAVLRYRGERSARQETDYLAQLKTWASDQNIQISAAPPMFAYFDPPWTPPFLRRNEVMLRIEQ